jgi:acyl-CoA dehydrogenase
MRARDQETRLDFAIPEDIQMVGEGLIGFVEQEVLPLERANAALLSSHRLTYDETGRYAPRVLELRREVRMKSAKAGFYTMLGDEALGGAGLGAVAGGYLQELLARTYGPARHLIYHVVVPSPFTNGLSPVLTFADEALKARVLPALASGEKTLCFALSEPDAGSDVQGMRTQAVRDGDFWVLNGAKQWITNSPYADYAVIFAAANAGASDRREKAITAFLVDTSTPGFEVTGVIPLMGEPGGDTGMISINELRVPDANRLGEVGQGLAVAMRGINNGRLGMAATCVGYAEWALAMATDYAKTRKTFGRPIADHQAIQFHLAEAAMDVFAAKNMLWNCAWRVDSERPARGEIAMVKCFATEMLFRVMDRCIQIHGAMGLTNELRLEAGFRYARIMRIPDGTAEIQRRTIAAELLGGGLII